MCKNFNFLGREYRICNHNAENIYGVSSRNIYNTYDFQYPNELKLKQH